MRIYIERTEQLFAQMKAEPDKSILYRNEIVELNLRLVSHVLKKYRPYTDDQYQAGCMGLILAVDAYDKSRGVPFPNFACFCIEREIHKIYNRQQKWLDIILKDQMIYLDDNETLSNGDSINTNETIPDVNAEEAFQKLLEDNSLTKFFTDVVVPAVDSIAGYNKGQPLKVDLALWKKLELRYIAEMADIESQKARINISQMSRALGISAQNVRNRHIRVITVIKQRCRERGYIID